MPKLKNPLSASVESAPMQLEGIAAFITYLEDTRGELRAAVARIDGAIANLRNLK